MEQVQDMLAKLRGFLDTAPGAPYLTKAEEATGVPKQLMVVGVLTLSSIAFAFVLGVASVCNLVGFVYPAYCSFKAIESTGSSQEDTQWLTYWVLYGCFSIVEVFQGLVNNLPFFYQFKFAFLLWCMLPSTRGASLLYASVLRDALRPLVKPKAT
ncbi:TB2/DP1, HVA22 family-domain-containing protein [Tribonema minus]|uniref:TB2/DP1, HVA22 family-domain-containing protein n=1 Tax=Tribonema minus TaxID=303371 RepID=A0A836CMB1_9STRA|nr:TB2/DP1, HVA22 family-domain-containing protein [Tribonema minus]